MSAFLSPVFGAGFQAMSNQGAVLAGGKLYTYAAGSTTAQATWTGSSQAVQNANPIVLDSAGRSTNEIWLQGGSTYKFVLTDSADNTLGTWDNIAGVNDANYNPFSEWVVFPSTATYSSATQFTVSGNQTSVFQVGRRVQYALQSGTFYGTVSLSSFSSGTGLTTITVTADSTGLDNTLGMVSYGFMSAVNSSLPVTVYAPIASPAFTGTPTAPTPTAGDNSTKIATTQFVNQVAMAAALPAQSAGTALGIPWTNGSVAAWSTTLTPQITTDILQFAQAQAALAFMS